MTDIELRTTEYNRQGETNALKPSPVNQTRLSPRSAENGTLVSPRLSQVTGIVSPRTRGNVIAVGHGIQRNEDQASLRSTQTPVEFVTEANGDVGDQTENRMNRHDVSTGSRINRNVVQEQVSATGAIDRNVIQQQRSTGGGRDRNVVHEQRSTRGGIDRTVVHEHSLTGDGIDRNVVHEQSRQTNLSSQNIVARNNADHRRHSDTEVLNVSGNAHVHTNRRSSQNNANSGTNAIDVYRHIDRRPPPAPQLSQSSPRHAARHTDRHSDRRPSHGYAHHDTPPDRIRSHRHSVGSRSISSGRTRLRSARTLSTATEEEERDERYVVPALPMPVAIVCCVLNFIIPGLGSMTASIGVLCCAKTEDMNFKEKCGSCCTVFGIGLLQLLLVACFLIGWIWSCIWGITFIGMSKNYYHDDDDDEYEDDLPVWERNLAGRTPLPAPQIVDNQPFPGIGYEDLRRAYERRRRRRQEHQRRSRSRLSDLIYPMRAPSNMAYNSPPPPYEENADQPNNRSLENIAASREEARRHEAGGREERTRVPLMQVNDTFRPMNSIIHEEEHTT